MFSSSITFIFIIVALIFFFLQKWAHKFFPKVFYYIPFSILFGFILLLISSQFSASGKFTELTNFMLAVIFALVPLSMQNLGKKNLAPIKKIWLYTILQHFVQWGIIGCLIIFVFSPLFDIPQIFVSLVPGGFAGGYGSAAMMGELFEKLSFPDMRTLLMASATVGTAFSILGGLFWLARFKGQKLATDLDDPGISLELKEYKKPLIYLSLTIGLGIFVSLLIGYWFKLAIPLFAGAFIASFFLSRTNFFIPSFKESAYFSDKATDLLVVFGIASIEIQILAGALGIVSLLWLIGLINAIFMLKFVAHRAFGKEWQEQGLFAWGWSLGGLMMGFALLKSINPKNYAKNIQDYSLAYMLVSPIEISLYFSMPWLLTKGVGFIACGILAVISCLILFHLLRKSDSIK